MSLHRAQQAQPSSRTRLLAYGLLAYCVMMILFGPSVAEFGLAALGCSGGWYWAGSSCQGLAMLPANALLPWLSAAPPMETTFLLFERSWFLLGVWLGLIALSLRFDRRGRTLKDLQPEALQMKAMQAPASTLKASPAAQSTAWIAQKQAEQAHEQMINQLTLHRRLLAEGAFWGSISFMIFALLIGLASFCLALGTPLIGGLSAEALLQTFGCANQLQTGNPWSGQCAFWSTRLEPYQMPWFGALLAPVWLFTQFSDVLVIWIISIALLALLAAFRFGWVWALERTSSLVWIGGLLLLGAAFAGQFSGLSTWSSKSGTLSGGLGGTIDVVPALFVIGVVLLLVLVAGLIALIVLVITIKRQLWPGQDQKRAAINAVETNRGEEH